ncbi:hypothetical protein ISU07_19185 [Nocardioides islandensis]|uniref:DUF559 domain-containing protein n=1 Tax=Nocardioides islandensis TaxID=433663 RepID=A0A930VIQ5_9ACTN|nr:hypothetical protein [Nocardioides islandensis]MBF4765262.1 hypothetical protein [Nocardioides islandensis]
MPHRPDRPDWRSLADQQAGLLSRRQLNGLGLDRFVVRNQVDAGRWVELTPMVLATFTGPLPRVASMWLGVLHAGDSSVIGGLTAAEVLGLRHWQRDEVTVLVPDELDFDESVPGVRFVRTRRKIPAMRLQRPGIPVARIEPAVLLWAAYQPSRRTAQGVVAAVIQQRLSTADGMYLWVERMRPLRWARMFRTALEEISGGAQSLGEIDVRRMCRAVDILLPHRQRQRRDATGKTRWTDCEWDLPNGDVLVLEVDGSFHMDVDHWEDDLARQRRLSGPGRIVVRCTTRELRDDREQVGRDLIALGAPRRAPHRAI